MFKYLDATKAFLLLVVLFAPTLLSANPVGRVVDVTQDATIQTVGRTNSVQQGQTIALGDVITTGQSGQVQLLFQDDTKIAISANSRLVIENILFNSPSTASTFTVNAVGGAFRFLSGNSEKSAYSVNTPNGTMGIRGTVFDFDVFPGGELGLVTFRGEVRLCSRLNRCVRVRGGCAAVLINNAGDFLVPENARQKSNLLDLGFPYIKRQDALRRDYRAPTFSCTSQTTQNGQSGPAQGQTAAPTSPSSPSSPDPQTGGAQAGNGTSSGLGGSSASGADAGAGGPAGPGDANAGDGNASAGGASAGNGGASAGSN